jgi:hypothetical protein
MMGDSVEFEVPVERGKIREFARAAQSCNPAYLGEAPVAPPTFLTVGRLIWQPAEQSAIEKLGFDLRRVLHAEEEYIYFGEPPHAGVTLTATSEVGAVTQKEGRRGGVLRFGTVCTRFRDPAGVLVAEQRSTFVETAHAPREAS